MAYSRAMWLRPAAAKLKKPIDEVAAGRVFTGQQALELGLVDKIGSSGGRSAKRRQTGESQGL